MSSTTKWVIVAVVAVVVLAAGIAIWSASGGEEVAGQTFPVEVVGDALPTLPRDGSDPAIGSPAPVLRGSTFDGSSIAVDPADGPLMVVFLAHWCPHCNREVPVLNQWKASGAVPAELRVIGVTTAVDPNAVHYPPSEWIDEVDWTWPVLADSDGQDAALAYGLSAYPFFTIVGADGEVKFRGSGEYPIDQLNQIVAAALAS